MLKIGDKEFRNLEEQVQKNLEDIQTLKTGIKIEKSITLAQLPTYTVESRLGQYFLVTDDGTKYLYLITLNNSDVVIAENLGEFPARGPQGIQGVQGEKGDPGESIRGPQGIQGVQGVRGRPGEGWAALDEIDATPYAPTFTEGASDIKVETSAALKTYAGTPDEDVKVIGLKYEVPAFPKIKNGEGLGSLQQINNGVYPVKALGENSMALGDTDIYKLNSVPSEQISADATIGDKLGNGYLISGTETSEEIPFSMNDFKQLTVPSPVYFKSIFGYNFQTDLTPFFTIVVDSSLFTEGNGYNCIWIYIKGSDGSIIDAFNLAIRKNGATVPPYFLNNYNYPMDDTYAEQYVIRAFVDYAGGKLYYCTGLAIGGDSGRTINDFCSVIDYDFSGSGKFTEGIGFIKFEIGNGMGGASSKVVKTWIKNICKTTEFYQADQLSFMKTITILESLIKSNNPELAALIPPNQPFVNYFKPWGHAIGNESLNGGSGNLTGDKKSFTVGEFNINNGKNSIVAGSQNIIVYGYHNSINGLLNKLYALAIDDLNKESMGNTVAGSNNKVYAQHSLIIGTDNEVGMDLYNSDQAATFTHGATIGTRLKNNDWCKTVLGYENQEKSDTLLEIGKGNNSNAFEVTKEGYIRLPNFNSINATTPSGYKTFKCVNGVLTAID